MAIKTAKRNTTKTEEKLASLETEKEEVEQEMRAMADKRKTMETAAAEVLEQLQAASVRRCGGLLTQL